MANLYSVQHWNQQKDAFAWISRVAHIVKNQIRCILLNEWPRDISLVPITWPGLPCLPECEWRLSLFFTLLRDKNSHSAFRHIIKAINQWNFHKVRSLIGSALLTNALMKYTLDRVPSIRLTLLHSKATELLSSCGNSLQYLRDFFSYTFCRFLSIHVRRY